MNEATPETMAASGREMPIKGGQYSNEEKEGKPRQISEYPKEKRDQGGQLSIA